MSYRRRLPVPERCCVCGAEIPDRGQNPGPPRTVCRRQTCESRRDAATRARRRAKEHRP